ncbi:1-phosphatidylinositol-bisphosphate phosphodiesterase gamma 2 [Colletotrichum truncatum]|uniref:1-phosphatidylinositol-bisphosphate phosphodiesterase gamma 2 n=1 Tax=Colletotrichum truncatum TaxID=5467 RepID=A0ACC3ZBA9_COLTU|nr:1-phosphatidylinositol-bisphosphate phosphodiesterase gamma 2 [Colletotrichum truncatum]KAF6783186.1 1-phosphatidylinositol-bisphosphate phosphodiesterase gamma 2 [Colletotrichum truncatum]
MASLITSKLANFNPFSRSAPEDEEELGENTDNTTLAGGGHAARDTDLKHRLRVSRAIKSFLVEQKVLSARDANVDSDHPTPALQALVDKPHISVPKYLTDRSHPLPEYFISSSHNTYLLAHQLYGSSSAEAYEETLRAGARCVEIDAWDNSDDKNEPKVTHGYTLVSNIPFRAVCETIRDVVDQEAKDPRQAAPILLSLENHCDPEGQLRLVQIMKEVFGDRLLSKEVREKGHAEQEGQCSHVRLEELGAKIVVIVEYHFPGESDDSSSSSSDDSNDEDKKNHDAYKAKKKAAPATLIIPELEELGVYAQSVKPVNNSWYEEILKDGPHHHLINVSESGLASHMPEASDKIARHNAHHLMRVFPKGTRISSKNLHPVPFWGVGAQICALNWQTFGASMQLNEALFSGSEGFILKPAALRPGGSGHLDSGGKKKLRLHVAGATDIPIPSGRDDDEPIKPYLTCTLVHPHDLQMNPPKRKTAGYRQHKLTGFFHKGENPPPTEPLWDETLEWEYQDNEMVFLRMLIKSDDSFAKNPMLAVGAVRLMYTVPGWVFIRMLDLKGRETRCSILVRFEVVDAE